MVEPGNRRCSSEDSWKAKPSTFFPGSARQQCVNVLFISRIPTIYLPFDATHRSQSPNFHVSPHSILLRRQTPDLGPSTLHPFPQTPPIRGSKRPLTGVPKGSAPFLNVPPSHTKNVNRYVNKRVSGRGRAGAPVFRGATSRPRASRPSVAAAPPGPFGPSARPPVRRASSGPRAPAARTRTRAPGGPGRSGRRRRR